MNIIKFLTEPHPEIVIVIIMFLIISIILIFFYPSVTTMSRDARESIK